MTLLILKLLCGGALSAFASSATGGVLTDQRASSGAQNTIRPRGSVLNRLA